MKALTAVLILLVFVGCGSGPTDPSSEPTAPAPAIARPAELPSYVYGAFVQSSDVLEAAANGGTVVLVVPSYADDASEVASALRSNGKVAIVSTHHVFAGPESSWESGWKKTMDWAEPFRDLIAAVYVVDEPLRNGISPAVRARALARVRQDGFKTMVGEWVGEASRSARPPVDLFGVTCYDWPGFGSWTLERCREAYRTHGEWDVAIGQGFDWHPRSGSPEAQVSAWADIGRSRGGVVFWVWDWPGQTGLRLDPGALAAYRRGAGW